MNFLVPRGPCLTPAADAPLLSTSDLSVSRRPVLSFQCSVDLPCGGQRRGTWGSAILTMLLTGRHRLCVLLRILRTVLRLIPGSKVQLLRFHWRCLPCRRVDAGRPNLARGALNSQFRGEGPSGVQEGLFYGAGRAEGVLARPRNGRTKLRHRTGRGPACAPPLIGTPSSTETFGSRYR